MSRRSRAVTLAVCVTLLPSVPLLQAQAPKPKPKPEASRPVPRAPAPRRAAAAAIQLVVEVDREGDITIDGDATRRVKANDAATFELTPGQHVVRAVSAEIPEAVWRQVIDVVAGQ